MEVKTNRKPAGAFPQTPEGWKAYEAQWEDSWIIGDDNDD